LVIVKPETVIGWHRKAFRSILVYTDRIAEFSIPIDLIPFRGVSSASQMIEWLPGRDIVLNVAGFEEAWASSTPVAVETDFVVRVASVPGLTLLKLIAWVDRRVENNKDAADLYRLLATYSDAGNFDSSVRSRTGITRSR
jgi:predicted nucleotidyltransferase